MSDTTAVDDFDPTLTSGAEDDAPPEQPDESDIVQAPVVDEEVTA